MSKVKTDNKITEKMIRVFSPYFTTRKLFLVLMFLVGFTIALTLMVATKTSKLFALADSVTTGNIELTAIEDTFIAENNPINSTSNGNAATLYLNKIPGLQRKGLIKFQITGIPDGATIQSALLELHVSNGSRKNGALDTAGYVAAVNSSWTESTTTWNNAPVEGNIIASLTPDTSAIPGETRSANVTQVITGNGEISFYLINNSPSQDDFIYTSSEGTSAINGSSFFYPRLRITWQQSQVPTPTNEPVTTPSIIPTTVVTLSPTIPPITNVTITHGPITGAVTYNSAKIFGRTNSSSTIQVKYATDPEFTQNVGYSQAINTIAANDYTAIVDITELTPNTLYYYRFQGDIANKTYQFKTFPLPTEQAIFTFDVFADLAAANVTAPAYAKAAEDNPAFVMQIGDFPHFNPASSPTPIKISNWWTAAKSAIRGFYSGADLANNILDKFPFVHMWDDHDYGNNNLDYSQPYKYSMALPALKSYYPSYPRVNETEGLWHSFKYGSNAEFFVLDLRSQRSPLKNTDDVNKSMMDHQKLANSQKTWFLNSLKNSTATWKFVVSSSVWNRKAKPTDDSWGLYKNEQQQIIDFIKANNIKNVVVLSGDIHTGGAIDAGTGLSQLSGGCTDPLTQSWCIAEISVPHTNMVKTGCTGSRIGVSCGTWDQGVIDSAIEPEGGYARIQVNGTQNVVLQAVKLDGTVRLQYTVNAN